MEKSKVYSFLILLIVSSYISVYIAQRDIFSVEDNLVYAYFFQTKTSLIPIFYEPFFDIITYVIRIFTDNYKIYFFLLNFLLNTIIFIIFYKIADEFNFKKQSFLLFSMFSILFSSWYLTAATNGLRQGIALALLYLGLIIFFRKENVIKSFLIIISSAFFHYSNFLILPLLIILRFRLLYIFILYNICLVFYFFNINQYIVKFISNFFSLSLYENIESYSENGVSYKYGFQIDFVLYTYFFSIIYLVISINLKNNFFNRLVKLYLVLGITYFLFGFASFSNRYGIMCWFFGAIINVAILYKIVSINKLYSNFLFLIVCILSLVYFNVKFVI